MLRPRTLKIRRIFLEEQAVWLKTRRKLAGLLKGNNCNHQWSPSPKLLPSLGPVWVHTTQKRNRKTHESQRWTSTVTTCDGRPAGITGIPVGREETLPSRWHYAPVDPRWSWTALPGKVTPSPPACEPRGQEDQMATPGLHGKVRAAHSWRAEQELSWAQTCFGCPTWEAEEWCSA